MFGLVKKGFAGKKNKDLWLRFLLVYNIHQVQFKWVKGHAGHPENERCDELAVLAAQAKNLPPDTGFEIQASPAEKENRDFLLFIIPALRRP